MILGFVARVLARTQLHQQSLTKSKMPLRAFPKGGSASIGISLVAPAFACLLPGLLPKVLRL